MILYQEMLGTILFGMYCLSVSYLKMYSTYLLSYNHHSSLFTRLSFSDESSTLNPCLDTGKKNELKLLLSKPYMSVLM